MLWPWNFQQILYKSLIGYTYIQYSVSVIGCSLCPLAIFPATYMCPTLSTYRHHLKFNYYQITSQIQHAAVTLDNFIWPDINCVVIVKPLKTSVTWSWNRSLKQLTVYSLPNLHSWEHSGRFRFKLMFQLMLQTIFRFYETFP